jgi:hypothetical protein
MREGREEGEGREERGGGGGEESGGEERTYRGIIKEAERS